MNSPTVQELALGAPVSDLPREICALIESALVAFDKDRGASRRDLMCAFELLRVARGPWTAAGEARQVSWRHGLAPWRVDRLIDYIESHLAEKITGRELANVVQLTTGQLFRKFRVSVGMPPFQYIALRRFQLACRMMKMTRAPLSQVALVCGLCDQAHLCRLFRRITGVTPAVWRRELEPQPTAPLPPRAAGRHDLRRPASEIMDGASRTSSH